MTIKLLRFGICRDIVSSDCLYMPRENVSVADFRAHLVQLYPDLSKLNSLAIATEDEYREDDFIIAEGTEVVLIPPVSGG